MAYKEIEGENLDYDSIYERYQQQIRTYWVKKMIGSASLSSRVLDVGCGDSHLPIELAKKGMSVHSIDLSSTEVERANVRARKECINMNIRVDDAQNLSFPDNFFDLSMCIEVLEYIDDSVKALKEMARVTKGYVIISVPTQKSLFFRLVKPFLKHEKTWKREYRKTSIFEEVEQAGLEIVDMAGGRFLTVPSPLARGPMRRLLFSMDKYLNDKRFFKNHAYYTILKLKKA